MDINTIQEIIKILDNKKSWIVNNIDLEGDTPSRDELPDYMYDTGCINALEDMKETLELLLNKTKD
jgi:hypothetical protein